MTVYAAYALYGFIGSAAVKADDSQVLVEATYRDLRQDRLVQGFVVTMRDFAQGHRPDDQRPQGDNQDELPGRVNRRSVRHKFRY